MNLAETFGLPDKKKHSLGVCIPLHARVKKASAEKVEKTEKAKIKKKVTITEGSVVFETEKETVKRLIGKFQVTGVFHVDKTLMLQGFVSHGKVFSGLSAECFGKKFSIESVQFKGKTVEELQEGQQGAIFLSNSFWGIKAGTLIEFQE